MTTATFEGYRTTSRDTLISRMVDHVQQWSHCGEPYAAPQLNLAHIKVYFNAKPTDHLRRKVSNAAFGSGWRLVSLD